MKPGHFHVGVRDLDSAIRSLEAIWGLTPRFRMDRMATYDFGGISFILDRAEVDSAITLAFNSDDCERDFAAVVAKGAQPIEAPQRKPWGACSAYLAGPGKITFEIEQPVE